MSSVWVRDGDKPFGTLLSYCGTYLHPDVYYDGIEDLKLQCSKADADLAPETKQFKSELRRVIVGDRDELPKDALFKACYYEDGSEEAFVTRLWTELFPDEPLPTKG